MDCSQAEANYGLNEVIAAEREENIGAVSPEDVIGWSQEHNGKNNSRKENCS